MKRREVVAVLAVGVVILVDLLGCSMPSWTDSLIDTLEPTIDGTTEKSQANEAFLTCLTEIFHDLAVFREDVEFAFEVADAKFDPMAVCDNSFSMRAVALRSQLGGCPAPELECLQEASAYFSQSLDEYVQATQDLDAWCTEYDVLALESAGTHFELATVYGTRGITAMERCTN